MSIAQQLIEKGAASGVVKGQWIGRIQLLEDLMAVAPEDRSAVDDLNVEQLQRRCAALQAAYNLRFRDRP